MIRCLFCLLIGYLCGSLLTAEGVARRFAGRSVFEIGDGNPGMANVGHELGKRAALICLAGDILKTLVPIVVLSIILPSPSFKIIAAWVGVGSTLGHIYPFWHGFKGGKGVTTIATTIILMSPLWGILSGVVSVATIILSGYLSVASVVSRASVRAQPARQASPPSFGRRSGRRKSPNVSPYALRVQR